MCKSLYLTFGIGAQGPLSEVGGKGLFTFELEEALRAGRIHLAVHSLKDLPTEETPGLMLAAVPPREGNLDALIANEVRSLDELRAGATIATGSHRRRAQLLAYRPDLSVCDLRGNVDTRLKKLRELGEFDAIVLAEAGLRRLGLAAEITQLIPKSIMLPAIGQGALGLETREDDRATMNSIEVLDHPDTHRAVLAERSLLRTLRGGCVAPIGAYAVAQGEEVSLEAVVLNLDGSKSVRSSKVSTGDAEEIGADVAQDLLDQGASELLASVRRSDR